MVRYPVEFPFSAAREVVRIFKSGTVAAERQLLGESVWNIQGYAQYMLLGQTPDNSLTIFKSEAPATDAEIIAILEEFDSAAASTTPRMLFPFDPQRLLTWCIDLPGRVL